MTIGSRIRGERQLQKMTLKKLAEKADISVSYLSDIEMNRSRPSIDRLYDLSKALGKSVSYFVDYEDIREDEHLYLALEPELKAVLEKFISEKDLRPILEVMIEEEDFYILTKTLSSNDDVRGILAKLINEPGFMDVLREFEEYDAWTEREKDEILNLLKAKHSFGKDAE